MKLGDVVVLKEEVYFSESSSISMVHHLKKGQEFRIVGIESFKDKPYKIDICMYKEESERNIYFEGRDINLFELKYTKIEPDIKINKIMKLGDIVVLKEKGYFYDSIYKCRHDFEKGQEFRVFGIKYDNGKQSKLDVCIFSEELDRDIYFKGCDIDLFELKYTTIEPDTKINVGTKLWLKEDDVLKDAGNNGEWTFLKGTEFLVYGVSYDDITGEVDFVNVVYHFDLNNFDVSFEDIPVDMFDIKQPDTDEIQDLLKQKSEDYCGDKGKFYIFESVAEELGISPELVMMVFINTKTKRINNLLATKKNINFESLQDNVKDTIGYLTLLKEFLNK